MTENVDTSEQRPPKPFFLEEVLVLSINLGIVGGGRACRYFLKLLKNDPFPYLNINVVGVCDTNPKAVGLKMAQEMGIYTTDNFLKLFEIEKLDSIIELTGDREVLLDIIRQRPERVGVLEHNIGRLVRNLYDVGQRLKTVEKQLVLEKMSSDFLIQHSSAKIVVLNTDFTIADANGAYLSAVQKPKEQVLGRYCYEVSHGLEVPCSSSHPEIKCPMVETLRTGTSSHVIHEHPKPGGASTYCNIVTYPLKNQSGEVERIIEVWRDITEEFSSRWEKRVNELKSDLQKLVQEDRMISLGKLAASCAHEINNPLQGLLTFSRLMEEELEGGPPGADALEQFKKNLSLMSRELERCGSIVSGLLSFSREIRLKYTDLDLNDVLQTVLVLTRHKMNLCGIRLVDDRSKKGLMIKGDMGQLQQCLLNLIFNAVEVMTEGGRLTVVSRFDKQKKKVVVEFEDTGCGIPKENLDHIFDPFFTTKIQGHGTGLGLSIVYGIVKNHQGEIKVESTVGKGSRFRLSFPAV